MMLCPQCERKTPSDAAFCPECGAKLRVACAQCRTLNAVGSKFCTKCGSGLPRISVSDPAVAEPSRPPGLPVVLVADDDPAIRALVCDVLSEAGFRTVTAGDGNEVLELARRHRPILIVLDIMMPHVDGYTALTRLRSHAELRDVPVLILTGQLGPLYEALSFGVGAVAHMTKPFSPRQLMETVERLLEPGGP
ncbi:MAG TPA: response regulator [Methylomirabilota bacterium]|jgi:CheY-like chemotaxis protein/RNA polymerase subunit RPABC4/transcription elongation factor Spt4|nr:response regulator [Methylomirabilota bacterium]